MNPLSRWQGVANILGDLASAVASLSWVGDPLVTGLLVRTNVLMTKKQPTIMDPLSRWQGVANILGDLASAVASLSWVGDPLWSAAFWSRIFILVPGSFGSWGGRSVLKKKRSPGRKKKAGAPLPAPAPAIPPGWVGV